MRRSPGLTAFAILLSAACQEDAPRSASVPDLFSGGVTVVDMTHALSADMPFWPRPGGNPFEHDTLSAHPSGEPQMAAIYTPEHHGTHLDAPIHGGAGLASVDELDLADLFAPAVVVDVSVAAGADRDYAATLADLSEWEDRHGRISEGAVVFLRTGWAERWPDQERYMEVDDDGQLHFPGFSPEAAAFVVQDRRAVGIGVDTPSVDPGVADGFPVHGIANGSGLYQLENVANLDALPEAGAYVVVAPIKIEGGSGGPVRIFGIVP
jgi:kynurenine formamidase